MYSFFLFRIFIEPIPCSIPELPANSYYRNLPSFIQQIDDGGQLEYMCENSRYRRRIFCRRGKIQPQLPICFSGNITWLIVK